MGRQTVVSSLHQELFMINCFVYPKSIQNKKKYGRKSIEGTSNIDIYNENCFKDLCFRPSENVLSHSSLPRGNVPGRRKEQHLIFRITWAPTFSFTTLFTYPMTAKQGCQLLSAHDLHFPHFLAPLKVFSMLLLLFCL